MTQLTTRHSIALAIGCAPIFMLGFANAAWAINDQPVSAGNSMLDIEFDTAGKTQRYTYCQPTSGSNGPGTLYAGTIVNVAGYLSTPPVNVGTCAFVGNGPEWGRDSSGTFVSYLDYDVSNKLTIKFIRPPTSGATGWTPQQMTYVPALQSPNVVFASQDQGSAARVVFMSQANGGSLTTQGLTGGPLTRCIIATNGITGNFPRFSSYESYLMYTQVSGGARQVFKADTSTACNAPIQLTNNLDEKSTVTAWTAPESGVGNVYGVLVGDNDVATQYKVYSASNNSLLVTVSTMNGQPFNSPETFQTATASYLLYMSQDGFGNKSIYVANLHLDPTNPNPDASVTQKKMSSSETRLRVEPEVGFWSNGKPLIYFSAIVGGASAVYRTAETELP